jgi:hypothetical protein
VQSNAQLVKKYKRKYFNKRSSGLLKKKGKIKEGREGGKEGRKEGERETGFG